MIQSNKQKGLLIQEEAITDYFDSLLNELPDREDSKQSSENVTQQEDITHPEQPVDTKTAQDESAGNRDKPLRPKTNQNGKKSSTSKKYLLCKIDEKLLAVPLESAADVCVELIAEVVPLTGEKHILGSMDFRGRLLKLIDTARLVSGEGVAGDRQQTGNYGYQYVVQLKGATHGLAFDDVIETLYMEHDDVRWRKGKTSCPWYSGISMEHGCVILDIEFIKSMVGA